MGEDVTPAAQQGVHGVDFVFHGALFKKSFQFLDLPNADESVNWAGSNSRQATKSKSYLPFPDFFANFLASAF